MTKQLAMLAVLAVICGVFFTCDALFGVDWKSYAVGVLCAWIADLLYGAGDRR
ncbi:hypothetical protein [Mesorhizobium sp.]|uniref:hypothetical protein n=1 Tax=Mesorhizobium sp. TaxID=1871066 RepID=UPI0025DB6FCF|nr:hypothetical protein [Mesorhizobium sp.]